MTLKERVSGEAVEDYKSTSTLDEADVAALEKLYFLQQRYQVLGFIEKYDFLVPLLLEAPEKIQKFFPKTPLFLRVITDPEEISHEELALSIGTSYNSDDAFNKLNEFEEAWWLDASLQSRGKLSIYPEHL